MRFELSDRDRQTVQTVGYLSQVSTPHLKELVYDGVSRQRMDLRLKFLRQQKLIKKLGVRSTGDKPGTPPAIYILDHKGWWFLRREGNYPTVSKVSEHTLHVADIYTGLKAADKIGQIKLLPESRVEKRVENMRVDLYVDVALPAIGRRRRYFVEVQENARPAVIQEKIKNHWAAFETSTEASYPRVVFVAKDPYIQYRIRRLIPPNMTELFDVMGIDEFIAHVIRSNVQSQ